MSTLNQDIDYIIRDFSSTVDALISFANVNYGPGSSANRLWSNFNTDSFSRNWLEIIAYISDVFFFYFDSQATQAYLQTSTVRSAVNDIARQFGFTPATASSASGNVVFTITGAGTVSRGFKVSDSTGQQFYLTNDIVAGSAGNYTGTVLQGQVKLENFSSNGVQNEEFILVGPNVIRDQTNTNPLDYSPIVTVNGNTYKLVTSFLRFNGTDISPVLDSLGNVIGGGGRVFTLGEKPDGRPFIRFGDGIFGRKLLPGETIQVTYRTGGGSAGNVSEQAINTLVDSSAIVSAVVNPAKFSGGADEQTIDQLRELIPASLRTLDRAVAEQDYSDILIANFSEVFAASTEPNTVDAGVDINIYVVPNGTGIAKISDNSLLKNRLSEFLNRRKMVTIQFQILDAFGVDILISLEVFIANTASKSTVRQAIQTALEDYFSLTSGGPNGSGVGFSEHILLKDINNIIEAISGIERFEIKRLTYRPRIQQNVVGLLSDYKVSEVTIYKTVEELEWLAGASGVQTKSLGSFGNLFDNASLTGFTYNASTGELQYLLPVDLTNVSPGDLFHNGPGLAEITSVQTVGDGLGAAEVTKVITKADDQGKSEITDIQTVADVSGSLSSTYFTIFDTVGSVAVWFNTGSSTQPAHGANRSIMVTIAPNNTAAQVATALQTALNSDSEFTASVLSETVTVTLNTPFSVDDVTDFNTGFDFTVSQQGDNPASLGGKYFTIYDDVGPVRIWFDVDNTSVAPPIPGGGRRIEVDIASNDSAVAVATALRSVVDADAKFAASRTNNEVTITSSSVGTRTDGSDFNTGFTISVVTQGAAAVTLGGKYFTMYDDVGPVRIWFDVDNLSVAPAVPGGGRLLEVDISAGNTANQVAIALQAAVDADAKFIASVLTNVVTITSSAIGPRVDAADDGVTGFTLNVTQQGVANNVEFTILGVDTSTYKVYILPNQPVNPVAGEDAGGSIRNGQTSFESFIVFKKLLATTTNLSVDSITDSNLDVSVKSGTGISLSARVLLDNINVYIPGELATGVFFLIDSASNIWDISSNDSNTIKVGISAVNDAAITAVAAGNYKIVKKYTNTEIVFNSSRFLIQYNTDNTFFSIGALFNQIGTIGDAFEISDEQDNVGNLGVAVDLIAYNDSTKELRVNGSPDFAGISGNYVLIDSLGQIMNVVAVDNRAKTTTAYNALNPNTTPAYVLEDSGLGMQYAQGFKVPDTDTYTVISLYLKRQGNCVGSLTARIVADDGSGLPDLSSPLAVSDPISVADLPQDDNFDTLIYSGGRLEATADTGYEKTVFAFANPPLLNAGEQYHVVLVGSSSYASSQANNIQILNNSGPFVSYTYFPATGIVSYDSAINLSNVKPGHYFVDGSGKYFKIVAINDSLDELTIASGQSVDNVSAGHVYQFDNVLMAIVDSGGATYVDGKFSRFDGSFWADDLQGPIGDRLPSNTDGFFTVEGPKSLKIESNLTPVLGSGATLSTRYYDDENQLSFVLGFAGGTITSAVDVNPDGKGTVITVPNSRVDNFVFRTSRYADDIVNLRLNEIPQIDVSDIAISILGGVD